MRNEVGQRLIEFCQENALVIANTLFLQHKRRLYTWASPDGQHQNQTDYILCSQRWRTFIQSTKTRPGTDCGSDHEILITKLWLKLKKVGKPARPFRYDLNQIPYDYTVEVRNRFKGLDVIECLMKSLSSVQFSSVAQSCPTLCDPMNRSMPGLPVHHQLTEFTQTHIHRVRDAIQPSHPLSSPSPPTLNLSQWSRNC